MSALQIVQIPVLSDNFAVLVHDPDSGKTAAIDAPDAPPILAELDKRGWTLDHIFVTHKHNDHIAGVPALKENFGCPVTGPQKSAHLTGIYDETVAEGDRLDFAGHPIEVFETPGHTTDHVTYFWPEDKVAFVGDTLFSLGCGRLFEGDAATMWTSLGKLMALPGETAIYCGHEYTETNADFSVTMEPDNQALIARRDEVHRLRNAGQATLPTTISQELATSPFLRANTAELKAALNMVGEPDVDVFAKVRAARDRW